MSEEDDNFWDDLDLDLASSKGEDFQEDEEKDEEQNLIHDNEEFRVISSNSTFLLGNFLTDYQLTSLSDVETQNPNDISRIPQFESEILRLLSQKTDELSPLLSQLNELSVYAQREVTVLHSYMKLLYKDKFLELEDLIPSPLPYANVVCILEEQEGGAHLNLASALENEAGLGKEQILVLMMSTKTSFKQDVRIQMERRSFLFEARALIQALLRIQDRINDFVTLRVPLAAPNVCALVSPNIASLLISHVGGIQELSQIPSCNLASIGKNKHLSHEFHTNIAGVRQEGFIYRCPLIQQQPMQYHKQMLRMVCAKVSLAARVDAGMQNDTKDDSFGNKWAQEISEKIQKLQDTTAIRNVKPLPIPEDAPKKKRAGRRFRKYKQQFQLSQLRQLQNRVEFGKQEQTITNSFGEEIGLGMTKAGFYAISGSSAGGTGVTKGNTNNSAKYSKAMKKRIEEANEQSNDYLISLEDRI
ncbi:hypothetical protein HG535_0B05960 [Zygotorulaspora mrakii]|uniref:Nop domain-containing protein n=1 Tax=Zygotorulaspora mrakii TaxID=42260 RepID=A0A7H9B197_ZYGMR|nr:uncharacterized protein HG535_0B05960 [Zygotorulaspora mrakii]QLG71552.1 hypothetical protein HG535_0B05960 [Zygotorulaspora mrakii]